MKMVGQTILITGGTSGIGLELARQLCHANTVIVTGRDAKKLQLARETLSKVHAIESDVSDPAAIASLYQRVIQEFPALNVLINNAGIMRKINMNDGSTDLNVITQEIETNVNGPIRMVKQFLPHLKKQKSSAIINVSSGLAFVPFPISPIYSATKAALHSFTVALRVQMKQTTVKVIELAPPATETPLFNGDFDAVDLAGAKGMEVTKLVQIAIKGIEKGELEVCPGLSVVLRLLSRIAPSFAVNMMAKANQTSLNRMLAQAAR